MSLSLPSRPTSNTHTPRAPGFKCSLPHVAVTLCLVTQPKLWWLGKAILFAAKPMKKWWYHHHGGQPRVAMRSPAAALLMTLHMPESESDPLRECDLAYPILKSRQLHCWCHGRKPLCLANYRWSKPPITSWLANPKKLSGKSLSCQEKSPFLLRGMTASRFFAGKESRLAAAGQCVVGRTTLRGDEGVEGSLYYSPEFPKW